MTWTVMITRSVLRQLERLPGYAQELAGVAVGDLKKHGNRPMGWNTRKTGANEYRLRLNYRYRMRYRVLEPGKLKIEVFYLGHRKDAYR